ncbi:unnamed protein product [Urochloa humidicola]
MQWFREVITTISGSCPLVVREQNGMVPGGYVVSLQIESGGRRAQNPGDRFVFHVRSGAYEQEYVAARDAVRKALRKVESHTGHCFPDYSFFKVKAIERNEADITEMPKMIYSDYESEISDPLYGDFLHTEVCLKAVLREILPQLGYSFIEPHSSHVQGGFQACVVLNSAEAGTLRIYGEVLDTGRGKNFEQGTPVSLMKN